MTSKILIADESTTIQKIVTLAFESEDQVVKGLANGKEAWDTLDGFQPDVVLADVDLPGLSGFDLSRKMKSSAAHQKRFVILLSSDFEEFDEKEFEASGADDHLSKPFKAEDIVSKVQRMLTGEVPVKTLPVAESDKPAADAPEAPAVEVELSAGDMIDALLEEETPPAAPAAELELSADDMIGELLEEKPPAAVVELAAEDMEPVVELSPEDMTPVEESPAPVELSAEDMTPEAESGAYLLTDDQQTDFDESLVPETVDPATAEPPAGLHYQEGSAYTVSDDPKSDSEETLIAETIEEPDISDESSPDFYVGERPRQAEAVEDLDEAFRSVSKSRPEPQPAPEPVSKQEKDSKPDLIRESQAFMDKQQGGAAPPTPASPKTAPAAPGGSLEGVMTEHALRVLEAGLERNLKKELTGLTDQVQQVVRDVVKEIAPEIIRSVIREEIENIRKMEEV